MVAAVGEGVAAERMKKGGVAARAQLAKFKRMVEPGSRAMLVVGNYEYLTLPKEDGEGKMGSSGAPGNAAVRVEKLSGPGAACSCRRQQGCHRAGTPYRCCLN